MLAVFGAGGDCKALQAAHGPCTAPRVLVGINPVEQEPSLSRSESLSFCCSSVQCNLGKHECICMQALQQDHFDRRWTEAFHHHYLIYPPACTGLDTGECSCLFSLYGSTNHGAVSSLCQGLDFIRSHMISAGCCGWLRSLCAAQDMGMMAEAQCSASCPQHGHIPVLPHAGALCTSVLAPGARAGLPRWEQHRAGVGTMQTPKGSQ